MKNKFQLVSFIIFLLYSSFVYADIDADVGYNVYYQDQNPFLEVSVHIVGSTLKEKILSDGNIETRVNVLIVISKDSTIVDFEKYSMTSPIAEKAADFIDLRRFVLPSGDYNVEIMITDQLQSANIFKSKETITLAEWTNEMKLSPVSLLSSVKASDDTENPFYKYGNILEPAAYNFFHQKMENLFVFAELYNSDKSFEENYALKYTISSADQKDSEPVKVKFKKYKVSEKQVILETLPISDLISGNYVLKIEIINNQQKALYTKNILFQRSNPQRDKEVLLSSNYNLEGSFIMELTEEELEYNLLALAPRLQQNDVVTLNLILEDNNIQGQRFFLYNYWVNFDPITTEDTFNAYRKIAEAVDRKFYNTVGRGFQTDRGYIFLKYGRPDNVITVENEPSAPPYEIWFYDKLDLTNEVNMKFLFYNPTLGGYNYELLHSTSRYEKQNRQWELILYSDSPTEIEDNVVDATTLRKNFNRRAREYFNDTN